MSQLNGAYYGPSIPPPPKSHHRHSRGGGCLTSCCGCIFNCILSIICKILTFILVLVAIAALLFWLIVRPNVLKVHVTNASLTQFNYTDNTLFYNLAVNVTIRNPNRRVGIYYDVIEALALYDDARFGSQTLGPFFQHHKNTSELSTVFKGQHVMNLGAEQVKHLNEEKGSGFYSIDVKIYMKVRFKLGLFKSHSVKPKIRCELHVPVKSRADEFQVTRCDWEIKRMFFH
ncbi:hypothetical protein RJT34_23762 [Clitoria ternatea]|uniref:Late embryogenesis abundant protein LEA-2 subgroup domain-containing protein n=1 Tax=Clitoria ternatea TaxID=43366 RepID=A0AAN9IL46_CLITE